MPPAAAEPTPITVINTITLRTPKLAYFLLGPGQEPEITFPED